MHNSFKAFLKNPITLKHLYVYVVLIHIIFPTYDLWVGTSAFIVTRIITYHSLYKAEY